MRFAMTRRCLPPLAKVRPKPRTSGKNKQMAARRRAAARRRSSQRWAVALIALVAIGVIVFVATRSKAPQGAASTALTGGDFHSMVVDPENAERLFAGGHSAVSVSINGAKTWREVPSLRNADAMGWAFTEGEILVGGHPGISVSSDGGKKFRQDNDGLPATDIHALGGGGGVVYAASPQAGFLASTDGRKTWDVRSRQRGQSFMGRILVHPGDVDHILAPDMAAGVVESRDGGRTWTALGGGQGAMWVSWNPTDPKTIVTSAQSGAAISIDGGGSWKPLDLPEGAQIVEMATSEPDLMYAGRHDGERVSVFVSRDGGKNWTGTWAS